jgi:hypothetical protein
VGWFCSFQAEYVSSNKNTKQFGQSQCIFPQKNAWEKPGLTGSNIINLLKRKKNKEKFKKEERIQFPRSNGKRDFVTFEEKGICAEL